MAQHGGKTYRTVTKGVTRDIFDINNLEVSCGRYLGSIDVERYSQVAVIGSAVAKELFGRPEDALGQKIIIQGLPLTVVGVLKYYELLSGNYNLLGAKNRDIFFQFLAEAVTLSFLGGLVGLVVSLGIISLWQKFAGKSELGFGGAPEITAQSIFIGLGFSIVVGILAGIYPALRAAKLNPITSLRYE